MQRDNQENLIKNNAIKRQVKTYLEKFDAKKNPITVQSIKKVLEDCLESDSIRGTLGLIDVGILFSFVAGLSAKESVLKMILPKQFLLAQALDEAYYILMLPYGKTNEHSMKYQFIKKLFSLKKEEDAYAEQWVQCFIDQVGIKSAETRAPHINDMIKKIKTLTIEEFITLFDAMSGSSSFSYIRDAVLNKEITVFDAALELFEVNGVAFTLSFCHMTATEQLWFGLEYNGLISDKVNGKLTPDRVASTKAKIDAKQDYEQFLLIAIMKNQLPLVIADIVKAMRESKHAKLYHEVKGHLDDETTSNAFLLSNCLLHIQKERDEAKKQASTEESPGMFSVFASTVKGALSDITRTPIRNASINNLIERLRKEEIAAPNALHEFLTSRIGQEGPHSLKYAALRYLFGCEAEVSKAKSQLYVKAYIRLLDEMIKKPQDMVLDEVASDENDKGKEKEENRSRSNSMSGSM